MKSRKTITIILSVACIVVNLAASLVKYLVGLMVNSVCILLDATNNFFDMTSGIVTLIAFILVYCKRSEKFPYGFGRSEYIAGFVVSTVAVVVGFNFLWDSISRLAMPEPVWFSNTNFFLILGTIPFKLALGIILLIFGKKVKSKAISAIVVDTFLDVGITTVSLSSYILSVKFTYAIDAWVGIFIGIVVIIVSIKLIIENLISVIGGIGCQKEKDKIIELCNAYHQIIAIEKMQIHDYGYKACYGVVFINFSPNATEEEKRMITASLTKELNEAVGATVEFVES